MEIAYVLVGLFYVACVVGSIFLVVMAANGKSTKVDDPVKQISQLQSWEYVRSLGKDGTK